MSFALLGLGVTPSAPWPLLGRRRLDLDPTEPPQSRRALALKNGAALVPTSQGQQGLSSHVQVRLSVVRDGICIT